MSIAAARWRRGTFFSRESAGAYSWDRYRLLFYAGYSPTPRTLLEIEAPFDWVSYRGPGVHGSFAAPGNATLWGKFRFYRAVETWGDRHAAVRVGLTLPTGVAQSELSRRLPDPIAGQLDPAGGAWATNLEVTYGQAIRRFVYHLAALQTIQTERGGRRPGHITRGNLDLEYYFLPRKYRTPTKELIGLLEVLAVRRTAVSSRGLPVPGTGGTQIFLAPGIQYIATRRLVVEASFQVPVMTSVGELQVRTKYNFLAGVRWLF